VSAQVGHDDAKAVRIASGENGLPVAADAGAAVQEQQWLAAATVVVVELKTVDVDDHGVRLQRRADLIQACGMLEGEIQLLTGGVQSAARVVCTATTALPR